MLISTKGRYALRVMIDLAEHYSNQFMPMRDIAERQGISLKYIERIMAELKKGGLIETVHGKGGGYRLKRTPDQYTAWDILELAEGDLAPVACLQEKAAVCTRSAECSVLPLWQEYYEVTKAFFSAKTLTELAGNIPSDDYVI